MDSIEFRLVTAEYGDGVTAVAVDPVIAGVALTRRLAAADVEGAPLHAGDALWPGRLIWLGERPTDVDLIEDDRVAVATCGCGVFGCGGVTAKIAIEVALVRWSDFAEVPSDQRIPIGPFVFKRTAYQAALTRVAEEYRQSGGRGP